GHRGSSFGKDRIQVLAFACLLLRVRVASEAPRGNCTDLLELRIFRNQNWAGSSTPIMLDRRASAHFFLRAKAGGCQEFRVIVECTPATSATLGNALIEFCAGIVTKPGLIHPRQYILRTWGPAALRTKSSGSTCAPTKNQNGDVRQGVRVWIFVAV